MATTSLWRVKGYIGKLILYAANPDKTTEQTSVDTGNDDTDPEQALGDVLSYAGRNDATENMEYVHGINCGVKSAKEDMMTPDIKIKKFLKKCFLCKSIKKLLISKLFIMIPLITYFIRITH